MWLAGHYAIMHLKVPEWIDLQHIIDACFLFVDQWILDPLFHGRVVITKYQSIRLRE